MFDIGFSELLVIALVALIVLGPERLPKAARMAGHLLGRVQRYVSDVKSDIQREMQVEDLKKLREDVEQRARDLETSIRDHAGALDSEFKQEAHSIAQSATSTHAAGPTQATPAPTLAPVEERDVTSPSSQVASSVPVQSATASAQMPNASGGGATTPPSQTSAAPSEKKE